MQRALVVSLPAALWLSVGGCLVATCALAGCGCDEATEPDAGPGDAGREDAGRDAGIPISTCDAGPAPDGGAELVHYTETRDACGDRSALRNLYFGDLHVHTSLSFDSYALGNRAAPDDAYRFARGEEIEIYGDPEPRRVRLTRPLDFAAVTDHAELLAETDICIVPGSRGYDALACRNYREGGAGSFTTMGLPLTNTPPRRDTRLCGIDLADCYERLSPIWQGVQDTAESFYDRTSSCSFTTFVAYEYTFTPRTDMMHRNVIFRNAQVPRAPISAFEAPTPTDLWRGLRAACTSCDGCDVLAIPHNPNSSAGNMFGLAELEGLDDDAARELLALRRDSEPVVEIMQHKGASECRPEAIFGAPDELCDYELVRTTLIGGIIGGDPLAPCNEDGSGYGSQCWSRLDYLRHVLARGLELERDLGVDPFELGFIGSTDTHNGTPGNVLEDTYRGHVASEDYAPLSLVENAPGGLAAVWAVENSRDAIFEALERREVYATSGSRIALRFFGGHGWDDSLCGDPDLVQRGYDEGVPMGGTLAPTAVAPSFVIDALRDVVPLSHVQIIKVWLDAAGAPHEQVFDVGGAPDPSAGVDPDTCAPLGTGADAICAVWTDPDWDPAEVAVYYARVLENPSCRWTAWQCTRIPEGDRPPACTDPEVPTSIRERAWSSPIWVR